MLALHCGIRHKHMYLESLSYLWLCIGRLCGVVVGLPTMSNSREEGKGRRQAAVINDSNDAGFVVKRVGLKGGRSCRSCPDASS